VDGLVVRPLVPRAPRPLRDLLLCLRVYPIRRLRADCPTRSCWENLTDFYLRTGSEVLINEERDLHELFQMCVDRERGYVDESGRPLN
jgi:hypothetical protein